MQKPKRSWGLLKEDKLMLDELLQAKLCGSALSPINSSGSRLLLDLHLHLIERHC